MTTPEPRVIPLRTMAELLAVSTEYISRKCRSGEWPHHRVGNRLVFTHTDWDSILEATAVPEAVALADGPGTVTSISRPRKRYPTWPE